MKQLRRTTAASPVSVTSSSVVDSGIGSWPNSLYSFNARRASSEAPTRWRRSCGERLGLVGRAWRRARAQAMRSMARRIAAALS